MGPRRARAALLCITMLLSAGASAAVSGRSDFWHVKLVGGSRECDACELHFEMRATGPRGEIHALDLPADGAEAVDAIHVWGDRAVIVQSFAGRFVYRVVLYALPGHQDTPGYLADDLLAAEFSVSPDGRYVLFRPARAPREALDRRIFLWDIVTRMPGAPMPRRDNCGGPEAPCPPNPDLHVLLFPRPPAPGSEDAEDPVPYPMHAVWDQRPEDPNRIRSSSDMDSPEIYHMYLDRLAFVALDRREWLTVVVVALDGADSAIDCYLPIAPYRRDSGQGAAQSKEVRSVELAPNGAVLVEMYGNAGVGTVYTVPTRWGCRSEREHWGEEHSELNPPKG